MLRDERENVPADRIGVEADAVENSACAGVQTLLAVAQPSRHSVDQPQVDPKRQARENGARRGGSHRVAVFERPLAPTALRLH